MIKPRPAQPGEVNYPMFDRFTFAHLGVGVVYGLLHLPFVLAFFLAVGWEVVENPMKVTFPKIFPHATADTRQNQIGDIIAVSAGWFVTSILLGRWAFP